MTKTVGLFDEVLHGEQMWDLLDQRHRFRTMIKAMPTGFLHAYLSSMWHDKSSGWTISTAHAELKTRTDLQDYLGTEEYNKNNTYFDTRRTRLARETND